MTQIHEAELSASEANGLEVLKGLYGFLREKAGELEAHQAEKDILDRVLAIGLEAMRAYFEAKGTGNVGAKLMDEEGREYRRLSPIQTKSYISLFGKAASRRRSYFRLQAGVHMPEGDSHPSDHARFQPHGRVAAGGPYGPAASVPRGPRAVSNGTSGNGTPSLPAPAVSGPRFPGEFAE